jgi:crotonobetainyl-CoA:carnitine CoA-transferase CaiB-like acyl-CoA transferase
MNDTTPDTISETAQGGSPRPLDGVRVLELATFLAGPFTATQMAEFGAEVIKVELPGTGDPARRYGAASPSGDSYVWMSEARNKRSVTIDMRTEEGARIIRDLVPNFDVVVENFQPGTLEKWGLGWDMLHAISPRLVMVRISGFGQTGPYRGRPGFGRVGNGFGGLSYLAGMPDGPPVTPGSATIADYMSGLYGTLGALMALRHRDATGEGQYVDIGLYEPIFRMLDELAPTFHGTGAIRHRAGPRSVNACPHSHYLTGDDRWVSIACTSDKIFARLAEMIGRPDLAAPDAWGAYAARRAEIDKVDATVTEWTKGRTRDEVLTACQAADVPCGPIYAIDEIFEDPQYRARGNIRIFDDPRAGEVAVPEVVPRLSLSPGRIDRLGPALGADTDAVLTEELGLDAAALARLRRDDVI